MSLPDNPPSETGLDDIPRQSGDIGAQLIEPVTQYTQGAYLGKGRLADKLAGILSASALGLSLLLCAIFFAGFVENDYHIIAVLSAFALTLGLGSFAVIPLSLLTILARKAYRNGGTKIQYAWCVFLIIPWCVLSILCLIYTPLPVWMSSFSLIISIILFIWSGVSLGLEMKSAKNKPV